MVPIWQVVVTLTGISGVGSLVFLVLYKEWIHAPVLLKLTRDQLYRLLRIFLVLTFFFVALLVALAAYEKYLGSNKVLLSAEEMALVAESRYSEGDAIFKAKLNEPWLSEVEKRELSSIHQQYLRYSADALKAWQSSQYVVFHEKTNQISQLLLSDKTKKYIDAGLFNSMANLPATNNPDAIQNWLKRG